MVLLLLYQQGDFCHFDPALIVLSAGGRNFMKVVLLQDIPGGGKAGEIKEVSKGYAKNFLLPRRLALVATPTVTKQVESRLEKEKLEESIDREKLVELAQQIEGKEIRLKARIGAGERLFGSITAADVAEELSRAIGSVIDKKKIDIEKPFRQTGSYEVAVKLASDIKPKITVVIEEEEKGKEEETEKKAERKQEKEKRKKAKGKEEGKQEEKE
jgi:large subunit ribosomal protein L9